MTILTGLLQGLLASLSCIYRAVVAFRNCAFDLFPWMTYRSSLPVVSVGNVSIGGTGKSPLVAYLAGLLKDAGHSPVILMRGYGGALAGPVLVSERHSAREVGDEAVMLHRLTSCPVVVSRRRVSGAKFIENNGLGSVVILDDGFQHRWLQRDLDLVCIDASSKEGVERFFSGSTVPAGILRESLATAMNRADAIVLNARSSVLESHVESFARSALASYGLPVFVGRVHGLRVRSVKDGEPLSSQPAVALSGIANPAGFHRSLEQAGFVLLETITLRDHQQFGIGAIQTASRRGLPVIVTEKDFARMERNDAESLFVASVSVRIEDEKDFQRLVLARAVK